VSDEHRQCALSAIHRLLKADGLFLIETMISHAGLVVGANYRHDARGVLSIKVDDPASYEGAFASGSEWFAPYRRIMSADQVLRELGDAGFAVQHHREVAQKDLRKPMLMQIRAARSEPKASDATSAP
jgi:hypothetical protein